MKKRKDNNTAIYHTIMQIINIYDREYKREYSFSEFDNPNAAREVALELKENKYAFISFRKKKFTIKVSGIRYLKKLINEDYSLDTNTKFPLNSLLVTCLALVYDVFLQITHIDWQSNPDASLFILVTLIGCVVAMLRSLR